MTLKWRASRLLAVLLAVMSSVAPAFAAELDPELDAQMRSQSTRFRLPVLLFLRESMPVPTSLGLESGRMLAQLRAFAEQSQASLVRQVTGYGSPYAKPLVLVNALSASLTVPQIESLLMREDVLRIEADPLITASSVRVPAPCRSGLSAPKRQRLLPCEPKDAVAPLNGGLQFEPSAPASEQVADEHVQAHWRAGRYGQDAVLAIVDTGVDLSNPEMARNFRGKPGDWLDVHREHATPTDRHGHGTRISSLIFGKHGSGENIGLAPRARWIAAKVFNDEHRGRLSDVYQAWAWLLDPDGNPTTQDAPDVVLNAWGLPDLQAACNSRHAQSLAWLRQARIHMVFPLAPQEAGRAGVRWPSGDPHAFVAGGPTTTRVNLRASTDCRQRETPDVRLQANGLKVADVSAGPLTSYAKVDGVSYAAALAAARLALIKDSRPELTFEQRERALRSYD